MILESPTRSYEEFLQAKSCAHPEAGIVIDASEISSILKPHQAAIVQWAIRGGRRAIFAAFGLGKTLIQLEIARLLLRHVGGRFLIVAPLGVRQEFRRDAELLGISWTFIRSTDEIKGDGLYLTNYESVREKKIDINFFFGASLDEAAILRGFGGTKTFRSFMHMFEFNEKLKYRFVATATPSPNEYIELLAYSAFLEIMDVGQAKTRFFKRDSTKADVLTLHAHKEDEFWLWMSSWAIFLQKPSDLGFSDEGYILPPMHVFWHEVPSNHATAGEERSGQGKLLKNAAIGVQDASREKRESLNARVAKMLELRALAPQQHRILWHDLEIERAAIELNTHAKTVYGSQDLEEREQIIIDFSDGKITELAGKPQMLGSGCNFQRHCSWAIFLGIGFKFADFIQAVHRIRRFLQTSPVRIDLIYTEAEREIKAELQRKWEQHNQLTEKMAEIIRRYGLASNALQSELGRSISNGLDEYQVVGDNYKLVNGDAVLASRRMEDGSAHLILTSIPFSTQYEYTPSYNDFGHTDSNDHFFEQMDYLTPELLRILQPGRVAAIHVKDRIVPGGMTGLGFQTVYPFHADCIRHFTKHGFAFLGMKTIVTDVVRENNQTYRLGWTEQCKDGSRMGAGMSEYLLLFRRPPSDSSNGYADFPVVKDKLKYSRSRWQVDAHGYMRSSGDRLLSPEDLSGLKHERIFKLFRAHSLNSIYDFEEHVKLGEALEERELLPVTFMLLQPQSWHPDVWTDITRMRTLNGAQSAAGREMHLCPLQFDIVDRVISQFSMEGETVLDPFGGLMTVPYCALKLKRRGVGIELNPRYFFDGANYCRQAEQRVDMPTLFDLASTELVEQPE